MGQVGEKRQDNGSKPNFINNYFKCKWMKNSDLG